MMTLSTNPFQACLDVLFSPVTAFNTVKEKKGWSWLPFILLLISTIAMFGYYFNVVDFPWLKEQFVNSLAASGDMSDDQIKAASAFYEKGKIMWSTIIGGSVGLIFINLIIAIYYHLTTKIVAKNDFKFTDWYAFTWWTGVPAIVSMLLAALVIFFASNGQVSLQDLQPTSLNSLIFSVEFNNPWFNYLGGITLFTFWIIGVAGIGLREWLSVDTKKAVIIAAAPYVLVYGSWALFILIKS